MPNQYSKFHKNRSTTDKQTHKPTKVKTLLPSADVEFSSCNHESQTIKHTRLIIKNFKQRVGGPREARRDN